MDSWIHISKSKRHVSGTAQNNRTSLELGIAEELKKTRKVASIAMYCHLRPPHAIAFPI